MRKPIVLAFAGPNGSGKTTLTRNHPTVSHPIVGTYVNADDLKKEHGCTELEAAQQAEALRTRLLDRGADFSFETVLSTERNLLLLQKAKERGYEVQCIYVLTCDENLNVARVLARHTAGGHGVPADKVRARYHRALALLPRLVETCDKMLVYDNTDRPVLLFSKENGRTEMFPSVHWPKSSLQKLFEVGG